MDKLEKVERHLVHHAADQDYLDQSWHGWDKGFVVVT